MVLGPHSPMPLISGHVDELHAVGEVGVMLLMFAKPPASCGNTTPRHLSLPA
ncbi:MAG TPA: hypothetical protein VJ376_11950 [Pseudomonadota bacterium]|nr:hypothetical protein [Pseudomonadota bacterium]